MITERGCRTLASALTANPSHLRKLDLSYNHPGDVGVSLLTKGQQDPLWRLETLTYGQTANFMAQRRVVSPFYYH